MATPLPSADNPLAHQSKRSKKPTAPANSVKTTSCHMSFGAAADVAILIAVLVSLAFLMLPCLQLLYRGLAGVGGALLSGLRADETDGTLTASLFAAATFFFLIIVTVSVILFCRGAGGRKCVNPSCRGLRNAAEFDVRIETEERVKKSSCPDGRDGSGRLFFELGEGHHGDLEAELKKMAPPNGRAILLFQEKCGCPFGRMVVNGPKKGRKTMRG